MLTSAGLYQLEVDGYIYKVTFDEHRINGNGRCVMVCDIYRRDQGVWHHVTQGVAVHPPHYKYDLALGRKIAHARAISLFDRDTRRWFWDAMWSRFVKPERSRV